jgi:hypothetical protein
VNRKLLTSLAIGMAVISLAGCGKQKTAQDIITVVKANMESAESMNFDVKVKVDSTQKYEDVSINESVEYNLNVDQTKQLSYITGEILASAGSENNKYEVEAYQSSENENNRLYYKDGDVWYRQEMENSSSFDMNVLKAVYTENFEVQEETTTINDKECYMMNGNISGEALSDFISMFKEIEIGEEDVIPVSLYTYKDLDYPAYIKLDLTNIGNKIVDSGEVKNTYNSFTFEMTFNSFNTTEISLSDEIKNDSKKKEETGVIQETVNEVTETSEAETIETTEENTDETDNSNDIPEEEEEPEVINELSTDWNSFQFKYDEANYRLPMAYKTFEASGYTMDDSEKSAIIQPSQEYQTTLYNGENSMIVKFANTSATSPKTLYECDLVSIDLDTYSLSTEELAKFMFNNEVTFSSDYDEVKDKWGKASKENNGAALIITTYSDGDNYIDIYFDPDDKTMIEYKVYSK